MTLRIVDSHCHIWWDRFDAEAQARDERADADDEMSAGATIGIATR